MLLCCKPAILIILIIFVTLSSCKKKSYCDDYPDNELHPKILGHTGMGWRGLHPVNSEESVKKALELLDGVEFDIQLSEDGVFFLFHDDDLSSCTKCSGTIKDKQSSYIKDCEYNRFKLGDNVIALDDFIERNKSLISDKTVVLDLTHIKIEHDKYWDYIDYLSSVLCNLFDKYKLSDNFYLDSRDQNLLRSIKNKNSQIMTLWEITPDSIGSIFMDKKNINGVMFEYELIDFDHVKLIKDKKLEIMVWGCNNKNDNFKALELTPDYIISDYVRHIIKIEDCK